MGITAQRPPARTLRLIGALAAFLFVIPASAQQYPRAVNMVVAQDGSIYLEGKQVTESADLTNRLQILAARRPQPTIYVSGQPGVGAAAVASAANLCLSAGLVCPTGRVPTNSIMGGH